MELLIAIGILLGAAIYAVLPTYDKRTRPAAPLALSAAAALTAAGFGLKSAVSVLLNGQPIEVLRLDWSIPGGEIILGVDALSAFFLIPLFVLAALCALYGFDYLRKGAVERWVGPVASQFGIFVASMAVVLMARHVIVFLFAWELMTLSSYFLVTFDDREADVRRAGWIYLIAGHAGVSVLILLFLCLGHDGLSFDALSAPTPAVANVALVLALVGFGLKCGLVPLHVWLPDAHGAAPSHVSALMSGMLVKLGIYGLLRIGLMLPHVLWWGPTLVLLGLVAAVAGVSLALLQRDIKRVLAYSTIENVGLIVAAFGLAFVGQSRGDTRLAAIASFAALLHLWNHVAMKGLMFLCAGSIVHATGSKNLEQLGGLMKRMPITATLLTIGAVAMSGLPPLNGFVSEWFLYKALLSIGLGDARRSAVLALCAVATVALIGALAALAFIRLLGISALGTPRSKGAAAAHESVGPMLISTGALAALMFAVAVGASNEHLIRLIAAVATQLFGEDTRLAVVQLAPTLRLLGLLNAAIWCLLGAGALLLGFLNRGRSKQSETWACAYAEPVERAQYSASSFSDLLASVFRPAVRQVQKPTQDLFPLSAIAPETDDIDPATHYFYEPLLTRWARRFVRLRAMQHGQLNLYLLYVLFVLVLGLGWTFAKTWVGR